jgi:hypothetical protein
MTDTLNAQNLKKVLWETLQDTKADVVEVEKSNAVASNAREILKTIKLQLDIARLSKQKVYEGLTSFAKE